MHAEVDAGFMGQRSRDQLGEFQRHNLKLEKNPLIRFT